MNRNEAAARQLLHRALAQLSKHLDSGSAAGDEPRGANKPKGA